VRILCLTHNYPRSEGDLAGAFIARLLEALAARGHTVHVVTPADRGQGGEASVAGVSVHRVRYAPAGRETLAHRGTAATALRSPAGLAAFGSLVATQARTTARVAREIRADIVHAQWWVPGGLSAWLARRLLGGPPYVVTLHGTDVALLAGSRAARALAGRVLRGAGAVTAVSTFLADRAAGPCGLERSGVTVQPMPLATDRLGRVSTGGAGLVSVGRLTAQKRIGLILEALALLHARGRVLPLTLVGDGPERTALAAQAARLGLATQVRFVGAVEPARVADAVGDADVFAFTAVGEGYGLAVAEAFVLGVPVVTMEGVGGALDLVPREGPGRVVPDGDVGALADAIADLAARPESRGLAAERGARLREDLAPEAVARRFESVYERVLSGPSDV
jgi:glycosyltransferase involved in cell wall biosynthesis